MMISKKGEENDKVHAMNASIDEDDLGKKMRWLREMRIESEIGRCIVLFNVIADGRKIGHMCG